VRLDDFEFRLMWLAARMIFAQSFFFPDFPDFPDNPVVGWLIAASTAFLVKFQQRYQKSHRPVILASLGAH
jgi:hypothetical protein